MSHKKGAQSVGLSAGNDLNAAMTEAFWLELFDSHRNENFAGSTSPALAWANTANHRFINFHNAAKPCVFGVPNCTTKSVQHRPSGLIGAKTQKTVERFSGDPVLRRSHVPGRSEPYREWCFRVMEDRACSCRNPATTRFTPPPAIFQAPPRAARTFRTGKTGRPAQPVQVIEAGSIITKPAEEIGVVLGVVHSSLRPGTHSCGGHSCMLASPHLSG